MHKPAKNEGKRVKTILLFMYFTSFVESFKGFIVYLFTLLN